MGAKAMDSSRDVRAAKGFAPSDGISLVAGLHGQGIGRLKPSPDDLVNLLFQVYERLRGHVAKLIQIGATLQIHS